MNTTTRAIPTPPGPPVCPVCLRFLRADLGALVIDGLAPGRPPAALITMHPSCYGALSLTTEAALALREAPQASPGADRERLVVDVPLPIGAPVRFVFTGPARVAVADVVKFNALPNHANRAANPNNLPIVAYIRGALMEACRDHVARVTETPGKPPHLREDGDPAMTVTVETRDSNPARNALDLFAFVDPEGRPLTRTDMNAPVVQAIVGLITSRGPSGLSDVGALSEDIMRLPGVQRLTPPAPARIDDPGRRVIYVDPSTPRPAGRAAPAFTSTGPPAARPLSPAPSDNPPSDNTSASGHENTASGGPLPPPGEVTRPMLAPLDDNSPEARTAQRNAEVRFTELLRGHATRLDVVKATIDRDPDTLMHRLTVQLGRRIINTRTDREAEELSAFLGAKLEAWRIFKSNGGTLRVVESPKAIALGPTHEGAEQDDEVDLRALPKWPRPLGTPSAPGQRVMFRAPIWRALFNEPQPEGDTFAAHAAALRIENGPALNRAAEKLLRLGKGATPEDLRHGVLMGYDAATDHAVVEVPGAYIATSVSWLMADTRPGPAQPTPAVDRTFSPPPKW